MSIQKLKNRMKGLEAEVFGHHGSRIPQEERLLIVDLGARATKDEVEKEFEILKNRLREKYGNFNEETDVICVRRIRFELDENGEMIPPYEG